MPHNSELLLCYPSLFGNEKVHLYVGIKHLNVTFLYCYSNICMIFLLKFLQVISSPSIPNYKHVMQFMYIKSECMKCSWGKRMRVNGGGGVEVEGWGRKGREKQLVMWCSWTLDARVYLTKSRTPGIHPGSFPVAWRPQILISTFRHQHVHFTSIMVWLLSWKTL